MAYRGFGLTPYFGSSFAPLFGLRREMDRLFQDALGGATTTWTPAVDVREDQNAVSLDVELPGIDPENVDVNVDNGVLTIRGEKRAEREEGKEGEQYHLVERSYGSFTRSFQLPQGVDEDQIDANFHDGVLTVRIPKTALPQPRKIQIGRGGEERQISGQGSNRTTGSKRGRGASEGERTAEPMAASEKNR
ncbi:MAG TPA: Hsp20/alpha crystallin family protein [Gemmatimonadaceae bacterium]|nr:Hsp20/alpha crystallin family protein [Gemmatimonadaceae bacterium]